MRIALRIAPAILVLATLPACFQAGSGLAGLREAPFSEPAPAEPEIDIWLNGAGGDSIDVWYGGPSSERFEIAEGVAAWLGAPNAIARESDYLQDTATAQVTGHFAQERGDVWEFRVNTKGLREAIAASGVGAATLVICYPLVDASVASSVPPDLGFDEIVCDFDGRGWHIAASGEDFDIGVTLRPDPAVYLTYAASVLLAVVLLGALAWWLGDTLRRGPFRQRNAVSVVIGLVAGGFTIVLGGAFAATAGIASGAGDNLALARHLTSGGLAMVVAFPALIATAPGIVFGTLLVRRRPWADEDEPARPVPHGPPPDGGVAPPPLPWG